MKAKICLASWLLVAAIHAQDAITVNASGVTLYDGDAVRAFSNDGADFITNGETSVPTKAAVKAYVDQAVAAALLSARSGSVVQTAGTTDTTNRSTSSTSWADSGVSVTITTRYANSRLRIRCSGVLGASTDQQHRLTLFRDTGVPVDLTPAGVNGMWDAFQQGFQRHNERTDAFAFEYVDYPSVAANTTVTYRLYWKTNAGTQYLGRRGINNANDMPTYLHVDEIAE